jgi:predicted Fe-S protein YdhL (DUF1289 family)
LTGIHITDIEAAINYWRAREPSVDGLVLSARTRVLAEAYANMVFLGQGQVNEDTLSVEALHAWMQWYASTPDTPCIAICSTSQGDDVCKGCGRTFHEVQHWPEMGAVEKRSTWRRITVQATAWRFNKYAERAAEKTGLLPNR